MGSNWQTITLPEGSKPVHNRVGIFLLLSAEQKEQYTAWKAYQKHDGSFWLYFGSGIKRKADEVLPGYQVLHLQW
jgi:hypothetical protein